MMLKRMWRVGRLGLALILGIVALAGCNGASSDPAASGAVGNVSAESGARSINEEGGLQLVNQLVLGTLMLEESEHAVTPEQAARLLPLWQMLQSGALESTTETNAVIKQIEGEMTEAQLAAIDEMAMTPEDQQAWFEEQGIEMAPGPGDGAGDRELPADFQNMSEEERANMREQMENASPEERAAMMAERGFEPGQGGPGGGVGVGEGMEMRGGGAGGAMYRPLIQLLTERAAE